MATRKPRKADPVPDISAVAAERGQWTDSGAKARWIAFEDPTRLVTIGPEATVWKVGGLPDVHGAIVRVIPPPDATDDRIGAVLGQLTSAGALVVKLMPSAAGGVVALPEVARPARRRHREVVEEMVAEAAGVDRRMLTLVTASIMDEEGL